MEIGIGKMQREEIKYENGVEGEREYNLKKTVKHLTHGIRCAAGKRRLGLRSPRSFRYAPFPRLTTPHFASPGLCCAKPLFGLAKRHIQPERYAPYV
jgi:hypothetical protein